MLHSSEMSVPHTHPDFIGPLTPAQALFEDFMDGEAAKALAENKKRDRKEKREFKDAKKKHKRDLKEALDKTALADIKTQGLSDALDKAIAGQQRATDGLDAVAQRVIPEPEGRKRKREALAGVDSRAKQQKTTEEREKKRAAGPAVPVGSFRERLFHGVVPWAMTGVVSAANMVSAIFVNNSGGAA